jgi:phenylacetate-CoA ligase
MLPTRFAQGVYWTVQPLRGRGSLRERLARLDDSQWMTPRELDELAFRKLERLLMHAYETVPYYAQTMRRAGFSPYRLSHRDTLAKLPVLTRADVERHFGRLRSTRRARGGWRVATSAGAGGAPARFIVDATFETWSDARELRALGWCSDWQIGERRAVVVPGMRADGLMAWPRRAGALLEQRLDVDAGDLRVAQLDAVLRRLAEYEPVLLCGYATTLHLLAEVAKVRGIALRGLRAIQTSGEASSPAMAEALRAWFGVPVLDRYWTAETGLVAHQSVADSDRMCIQAESSYVEFVSERGTPCAPGEDGAVVVTTLDNYAMPLIRYRTSDIAAPLLGHCPRGRGLPLMSKVRGRTSDVIRLPSGERVPPQVFAEVFGAHTSIVWYQVVQERRDSLRVALLLRCRPRPELEQALARQIQARTGARLAIEFEYPRNLPRTPAGKHRPCVPYVTGAATRAS